MTGTRTASPITPLPQPSTKAVGALALFALALIVLPVFALGVRVPFDRLGEILTSTDTHDLLRVTLTSAVCASVIAMVLGVPLALWLQRLRRGARLARLLVLLPLALPPVVAGLALSAFIGRRGIAAPLLDLLGWQFAFAFPGVVAAHVFIALPFVVITLDAALRQLDPEITSSAAAVGITPARTVRQIILPAVAPSLVSAAGLAFARSLGEFGTTLTFAGSMPGTTRTMPLGIYLAREVDAEVAYGLSAILIGLAVLTLAATALPALFSKRAPAQKARATGTIDVARLRELTRPAGGGSDVEVEGVHFPANTLTALVGPNGAGKTTLVGRIAGRLRGASVTVGDRLVDSADTRPVPAYQRGVVLLTQNPGLPPTATASSAITMVTRDPQRTAELLDAAGLAELADVPVRALSGGQAAQVSLVRALATRPAVLILDEPLAAIDVDAAAQWRQVLHAARHDRTTVLITHNALDVLALADHIAVMGRGRVRSFRPASEEVEAPASRFAARLVGANLLAGTVGEDGTFVCAFGALAGLDLSPYPTGTSLRVTFPPEALTLVGPGKQAEHGCVFDASVHAVSVLPSGGASVTMRPPQADDAEDAHEYALSLLVDQETAVRASVSPGAELSCALDAAQVRVTVV
ncbi:molybdate transport system permease [Corynebacterium imitans]|uniref:Molybdate transport system permease n=1 Tax=Corynebacterium imitans TaxID=156978 RepID=A0A239Z7B1_9CORY|nr:ATP-binding cassette domain-containing protein [Corynebacterium imitans]SNV67131.1 molybdate transport system permease [Corynebacterium imitans]